MNRRHRWAAAALACSLALVASACSSDADTAATTSTGSPTAPTASGEARSDATAGPTTPSSTTTAPAPVVDPDGTTVRPAVAVRARTVDATLRTPDGRERTYHLHVPPAVRAGTDGPRVPLLVALHGGTGSGLQFERSSGFSGLAEANDFIVAYPDGIGAGARGTDLRTWNGGACCGPAVRQDVDDVAFVRLLIDRVEAEYPVDADRVFAAGHSNGGILAYRLACELADRVAAIGVQSSALELDGCRPSQPVSVLHIHGSGDQNVPIDGGIGPNAISGVAFQPPIDGVTTLAAADGCPDHPEVTTDPANPDLTIRSWTPCGDDTEVAFLEVAGASHAWMGHPGGGSGKVGPVYEDLDSSLQIWDFLSRHGRR
ncbi:hypothetical protein KSP35_20665 [Aquihabitans sp. G128]|uniref:alpha/beta hydrolase family esterase n=1 Tax=Aquihabitans sp. G128 TaxID=2849779 RepID=UPI001C239BE4|nr:PHB depolymerase family esterase [Aquihabitans sp. G128]QXC60706.1 hypothetical protein KSP35_20665 [Aquihabitans sp. G128]